MADPAKKKKGDLTSQYLKLQAGRKGDKRPWLASECKDLNDAERFRMQIIAEIKLKISEIQNAALGEFRIRELNDEINKLVREKGHWQRQIKHLNGPDHFLATAGFETGSKPAGSGGYAYYGAARNLPGVRELFEVEAQGPVKRTRAELYRTITPDYYGFRDEDDGLLLRVERRAENKHRTRLVLEKKKKIAEAGTAFAYAYELDDDEMEGTHVNVPSQAEVEERMLQAKKRILLERYGISADMPFEQAAAPEGAVQGPSVPSA
eukprot:TRINITY_DN23307_c0_g1_i1.p1 TRINITY_DN23307_c0_g1~~TRINITY_DN23307_c0_g1_i1.p1  ORF type:complete len:264 (+),score=98.62 TRINITY_DN23307_c0_g1_i1:70-861(+)